MGEAIRYTEAQFTLVCWSVLNYIGIRFDGDTFGEEVADNKIIFRVIIPKESKLSEIPDEYFGDSLMFGPFKEALQPLPRTYDEYIKSLKKILIVLFDYEPDEAKASLYKRVGIGLKEEDLKEVCRIFAKQDDKIWTDDDAEAYAEKFMKEVEEHNAKFKGYEEV